MSLTMSYLKRIRLKTAFIIFSLSVGVKVRNYDGRTLNPSLVDAADTTLIVNFQKKLQFEAFNCNSNGFQTLKLILNRVNKS